MPLTAAHLGTCGQRIVKWRHNATFDSTVIDQLEYCTYLISFAWDQVLAGDVDDLLEGADLHLS